MTIMADKSLLTVYKASAGSGKTFRLAVRYIAMLVANPRSYSGILAVTFTNKATAEMKRRILSQLFGIANGLESSVSYLNEVQKIHPELETGQIRSNAARALDNILQDYGHFRIETIDSFFQTVLSSLARELHQGAGMNIDLDTEKAVSDAVDDFLDNVDKKSPDFKSLTRFIEGNIEEDRNWDVRDSLKKFAGELFRESFAEKVELLKQALSCEDAVEAFRKKLVKERDRRLEEYRNTCADAFRRIDECLRENGLSIDDMGKNPRGMMAKVGDASILEATGLGTLYNCCDSWEKFFNKNILDRPGTASWAPYLSDLLRPVRDAVEKHQSDRNSFGAALTFLHELGLLMSVRRTIDRQGREQNRFLLADTASLLSELKSGDTSFVFEKTGSYIRHLMIDEFQDTSRLQWNNLYLLLLECLSGSSACLVVGDVKQSIYRWRNGDWNILNTELTQRLAAYSPEVVPMQDNYRSLPQVVGFNNRLFPRAADEIQRILEDRTGIRYPELDTAYYDVMQNAVKSGHEGFVRVCTYVPGKDDEPCLRIADIIDELTDNGVLPSDIAVLCRFTRDIEAIAGWFAANRPEYRMVSAEAFKLDASAPVRIMVNALRWIADRNDRIALAGLLWEWLGAADGEKRTMDSILTADMESLLPDRMSSRWEALRGMSLYELVEQLYMILGLDRIEGQDQYVMAFFDTVSSWLARNSGNVSVFLKDWDDRLHKNAIPQEQTDGISLLTIHKSKGLEFHTVIVPYCDWQTVDFRNRLWVEPKMPPFDDMSLLPVPFQSKLSDSVFRNDYLKEYGQQAVDNLNLLYVAFTRAACNLAVISRKPDGKGGKSPETSVYNVLYRSLTDDGFGCTDNGDGQLEYECGSITPHLEKKIQVRNDNPFESCPVSAELAMRSWPMSARFRQSGDSVRFAFSETSDDNRQNEFIERGSLLHGLFSAIATMDDIDAQVGNLLSQGLIDSEKQADSIRKYVRNHIVKSGVEKWFSGKCRLLTENEIVFREGMTMQNRRPDRVMMYDDGSAVVVDFKFARQREEYMHQVQEYMALIGRMGVEKVNGYLWYVDSDKVIEVIQS